MAQCQICSHPKVKEANRWILTGRREKEAAKEFGFNVQALRWHKRRHLPWRPRWAKAVTVEEQFELLKYELCRLQILGECGEPIGGAIQAVRERRALLELELRLGDRLSARHAKMLPGQVPSGEFEVVFQGGRPKTVKKVVNE